jgi:type II secretory pathway pseudopilin PulG
MTRSSRGVALVDVLVAAALMVTILGIAVPSLLSARSRNVARLAARHMASRIQVLRLEALKRNAVVAWRLDPGELGLIATVVDGDGDGVRQVDMDAGIDRSIQRDLHIRDLFADVSFRIARDVPNPDASGTLLAGSDPIRIGTSNFLAFSASGSTSSGTLYLADQGGSQVCVRIFGATGRVRVLWFDEASGTWRQD